MCDVRVLGQFAQQLTHVFNCLIGACKGLMATCNSPEFSNRIKLATQELGKACIDLVNVAGRVQNEPRDKTLRQELNQKIDVVGRKVNMLLASLQASAKGTQACISADNAVNGIIADLNTVAMFATAGTLKSEADSDAFGNHREAILRTAKALVEDTKALVSVSGTANIDQDELAIGVHTSVKTITKLAEAVKLGAASLGCEQPEAQVLLVNSVRDVAAALSDLITAIKLVSCGGGVKANDENPNYVAGLLRDSAKNMVTNVQSLLKTVKTVEDEAARGTRALESAIDAIYQEIKFYSACLNDPKLGAGKMTEEANEQNVKPEDLIRATKQITLATSKAIGAGNSLRQEDIISAANMGRKAVSDLLFVSRAVSSKPDRSSPDESDIECRRQLLGVGLNCAIYYKELLESVHSVRHIL